MSYVTQDTIWPIPAISDGVKQLVAKFYELADCKAYDAGPRLATEVFTPDASMITPAVTFQGSTRISSSRENAWNGIASREHRVSQVFSANAQGLELMLCGTLKMVKANGDESFIPFACHFKADKSSVNNGSARFTSARVYAG